MSFSCINFLFFARHLKRLNELSSDYHQPQTDSAFLFSFLVIFFHRHQIYACVYVMRDCRCACWVRVMGQISSSNTHLQAIVQTMLNVPNTVCYKVTNNTFSIEEQVKTKSLKMSISAQLKILYVIT